MRSWWGVWALVLGVAGCHSPAPVLPRPAAQSVPPPAIELPVTAPEIPVLDGRGLGRSPAAALAGPGGNAFRRLTETDCLRLSAAASAGAALHDDEGLVPPPARCATPGDDLRDALRHHTSLELRNQSAADALDRFHQLADVEARTDVLRKAFPVIDPLLAKATEAQAKSIRYPLDPADLGRQRSQLLSQLEQAELGSRLLNLDLKRRLGLPYHPADERLWPSGDFAVDPTPADPDQAANAALADRPELRGLRALRDGLSPETLPDLRDLLHAASPLLGPRPAATRLTIAAAARRLLPGRKPDAALLAELETRRKQLADLTAARERLIADEARAAALTLNAQRARAARARDRLVSWDDKLADAVRQREAGQPNAELLEAQTRMEWLRAKSELISEVAAWHRARVKLRAAMGWLAWEAAGPEAADSPR
jgi:hypothetical protein